MSPINGPILKTIFFTVVFVSCSSCNRKEAQKENILKNENLSINHKNLSVYENKEKTESYFFLETSNVSHSLISKSQVAQKRSESSIVELSKKIEDQQNLMLKKITEVANKKLIVISDISVTHKRDLYKLMEANNNDFNKTYLNSISESLSEQIKLFESISAETEDETILKLVLQFLPTQYQLLREIEKTKAEFY